MGPDISKLKSFAFEIRKNVLDIIAAGKGGHIGGDMSEIEILLTLYFLQMDVCPSNFPKKEHDRFILSKGHCVEALYAVLAAKGFFSLDEALRNFSRFGSPFIGHPNNKIPGIEMNSGSLGHGLSVAVGMAMALKSDNLQNRVYVLMGDGELAEGSVWEGAMCASHYKLDNLCAVIDRNGLQISGSTESVMAHEPLSGRFESFGWNVIEVAQGNDIGSLNDAFEKARKTSGKPTVVIAHTVKGYGSPIMENKAEWHHKLPTGQECLKIAEDFEKRRRELLDD